MFDFSDNKTRHLFSPTPCLNYYKYKSNSTNNIRVFKLLLSFSYYKQKVQPSWSKRFYYNSCFSHLDNQNYNHNYNKYNSNTNKINNITNFDIVVSFSTLFVILVFFFSYFPPQDFQWMLRRFHHATLFPGIPPSKLRKGQNYAYCTPFHTPPSTSSPFCAFFSSFFSFFFFLLGVVNQTTQESLFSAVDTLVNQIQILCTFAVDCASVF